VKYRELVKLIENVGWRAHHQRGSHIVYRHPSRPGAVVVAGGGKTGREVPIGTQNAILKQAGLK
jgi:predicted RNA binding protein YcfA (HicA-like mRNA interferase family)